MQKADYAAHCTSITDEHDANHNSSHTEHNGPTKGFEDMSYRRSRRIS